MQHNSVASKRAFTAPRLENVTDDHCNWRLRSQIFPVPRSGIILTVCFVRKRTLLTFWAFWEAEGAQKAKRALFLAKQTYEKWHHFFGLAKIRSTSPLNDSNVSWHCRSTGSESGVRKKAWYYHASLKTVYPCQQPCNGPQKRVLDSAKCMAIHKEKSNYIDR